MFHFVESEEVLNPDLDLGLRKRKIWDPETESITSEIKDLLEEDVNSLVSNLVNLV